MSRLPLAGIRIADVTQIWAGPHCTRLLADLGAEIVRIESIQRPDMLRGQPNPPKGFGNYPDGDPGERPYNRHGSYNAVNLNKLGLTLNLAAPDGASLFKRLVCISDVVVENFRFGVMEKFGLGYDVLSAIRPDLIMLSMPAFGRTGPERAYAAYGINQEQLSSMASLTGYHGEGPMKSGINVGDPISGLHAAGVVLAGIRHRRRTGEGQFIEVSQLETNIPLIGENVVAYGMNRRNPEPLGNRHSFIAPHGCYPCQGEDAWVAIAAFDDNDFANLVNVIGQPMLASDPRFLTNATRYQHQDELDEFIAAWTRKRSADDTMKTLQGAGVAAGAVLNPREVIENPHVESRHFFVRVDHPEAGNHLYPGVPLVFSKTPHAVPFHAPLLGEHNCYILQNLLGVEPERFHDLEARQVIGTRPLW
jgi:crotonobetainyl-CoA:carnitine CoA-transferase CaiB-like acyl-CoA transferase